MFQIAVSNLCFKLQEVTYVSNWGLNLNQLSKEQISKDIAAMIVNRRTVMGLSQSQLYREMKEIAGDDFALVTLARLESGKAVSITPNMANALNEILNIPMTELCSVQGYIFKGDDIQLDAQESALIGQIRFLNNKYKSILHDTMQFILNRLVKQQSLDDSNQD
tara:strand:+ start:11 stop:502 length:492 start_codon:yes stop_codon:yes gene_type:complete